MQKITIRLGSSGQILSASFRKTNEGQFEPTEATDRAILGMSAQTPDNALRRMVECARQGGQFRAVIADFPDGAVDASKLDLH